MPTLFHTIAPLASSHAPQLVVSLVACGAVLLAVSDFRLGAWVFLMQRLVLIVLLWSNIGIPLAIVSAAASFVIALLFAITAWRVWYGQHVARKAATGIIGSRLLMNQFSVRVLSAALGLLVTYGLVQKYHNYPLPFLTAFTIVWFFISSLFSLLLADSALRTSLGILGFADGCRILYALWQPNPTVWGLWMACDVLVALAAAYLRNAEVVVIKNRPPGGNE